MIKHISVRFLIYLTYFYCTIKFVIIILTWKIVFFQNFTTFEYLYLANSSRLVLILSCHCDCVEVSEYKSKNDLRSWQKCVLLIYWGLTWTIQFLWILKSEKSLNLKVNQHHMSPQTIRGHLRAGHQTTINMTKQKKSQTWRTERQMNKMNKKGSEAQGVMWSSCRKLSCIISGRWGSEVSTMERQTAAGGTYVPEQTRDVWTHPDCCFLLCFSLVAALTAL